MDWKSIIESLIADQLSVEQIAERMGVTGNAIREVLSGRTKSPRAEAAMELLTLCAERGIAPAKAA